MDGGEKSQAKCRMCVECLGAYLHHNKHDVPMFVSDITYLCSPTLGGANTCKYDIIMGMFVAKLAKLT